MAKYFRSFNCYRNLESLSLEFYDQNDAKNVSIFSSKNVYPDIIEVLENGKVGYHGTNDSLSNGLTHANIGSNNLKVKYKDRNANTKDSPVAIAVKQKDGSISWKILANTSADKKLMNARIKELQRKIKIASKKKQLKKKSKTWKINPKIQNRFKPLQWAKEKSKGINIDLQISVMLRNVK